VDFRQLRRRYHRVPDYESVAANQRHADGAIATETVCQVVPLGTRRRQRNRTRGSRDELRSNEQIPAHSPHRIGLDVALRREIGDEHRDEDQTRSNEKELAADSEFGGTVIQELASFASATKRYPTPRTVSR